MSSYQVRKKHCYTLTIYYTDAEQPEDIENYFSYTEAEEARKRWLQEPDIEAVEIEEQDAEFFVDPAEALQIDVRGAESEQLLQWLDEEYRAAGGADPAAGDACRYELIVKELRRRLKHCIEP